MSKILQGKVLSSKMKDTSIVEVSRFVRHTLYKKLLKKSKKYKVDSKGQKLEVGQVIKIIETRPTAKDKHFTVFTGEKKSIEPTAKPKSVTKRKANDKKV